MLLLLGLAITLVPGILLLQQGYSPDTPPPNYMPIVTLLTSVLSGTFVFFAIEPKGGFLRKLLKLITYVFWMFVATMVMSVAVYFVGCGAKFQGV